MYYIENTVFHAGARDCWGLLKGEKKPLFNRHGEPITRRIQKDTGEEVYGLPARDGYSLGDEITFVVSQAHRIGEGKLRDLDAARNSAVWPEATDAELTQEPEALKAALLARLPALLADFRAAVESLGFTW